MYVGCNEENVQHVEIYFHASISMQTSIKTLQIMVVVHIGSRTVSTLQRTGKRQHFIDERNPRWVMGKMPGEGDEDIVLI